MNKRSLRNAIGDFGPCFSVVIGFIDEWQQFVILMAVDCDISRSRIMRGRFDQTHPAPLRPILGRHIRPIVSSVARELDEAVVRTRPNQTFGDWGLSDGKNGIVV